MPLSSEALPIYIWLPALKWDAPSRERTRTARQGGQDAEAIRKLLNGAVSPLARGKAVSGLKPGDELPVSLALDGALVDGELEIVPENGRSAVAKTSAGLPAVFSLKEPGRYLLTASVEGRGCSLVFQVQESGEESE